MNLTLAQIAVMCGGTLSAASNPELLVESVVIDSRNIGPGSLFVAIKGEHHDGHSFVAEIFNHGAACALVSQPLNYPNLIYVHDTIQGLGLLAYNYRKMFNIPVAAITGSNGKTTVKEMLNSICVKEFGVQHVLATAGNLNNHIGVPLTLLKLNQEHKVAIIEMGMNHAGEIDYLSKIVSPTIAVVNNVMLAHAGFFNDLSDIARAKGEIYNGLANNGIALINQLSPFAQLWQNQLNNNQSQSNELMDNELLEHNTRSIHQVGFGIEGSSCYLKHSGFAGELLISTRLGDVRCTLKVLGEHNKLNAITSVALADKLLCSKESIIYGLENYTGHKGRLEQKTAFNGAMIIDDSYNANPDSVKAAILAIKNLPKPHWFIFADLKEQGKFTQAVHEDVASFSMHNGIDCLITIGESSKITHDLFNGDKRHFANNQDIVEYCRQNLPKSATLLVKGSNCMGLGSIVDQLI
ncbi:MAG: UDP-N-acetylmuramoyl-tripeptide--D-alanyl-D-alanine ligase [Pseudomonadota bacterium]|nr:UDP-N-acetylmuramoyl-tripeptide--D-alanyl-D-alanine ligase [Pseudomonadota bacterium]